MSQMMEGGGEGRLQGEGIFIPENLDGVSGMTLYLNKSWEEDGWNVCIPTIAPQLHLSLETGSLSFALQVLWHGQQACWEPTEALLCCLRVIRLFTACDVL